MRISTYLVPMTALLLGACASQSTTAVPAPEEELGTTAAALSLVNRGATCQSLGLGNQQLTLTAPPNGQYALDATNHFAILYDDETNTVFRFHQSTMPMTGVLVSNGSKTLVWEMPEGQTGYGSLHGPPQNGEILSPEEISFCYDYELRVQPSPYASHSQRPNWSITKTASHNSLTLAEGQEEEVDFEVTVKPNGVSPAGQRISGPLFLDNNSPHTVTVSELGTLVGTIAADISCPSPLPFTIPANTLITCNFSANVPDTSDRTVKGSGTVSHGLKITGREVVASFSSHTTSTQTIDRCVAVRDDAAPYNDDFLGSACVEEGEKKFAFTGEVGPYACGTWTSTSTATYTGLDSGATGNASWQINGLTQCNSACTLGAGYWRRHSQAERNRRRYNPTWNLLGPDAENEEFLNRPNTSWQDAISTEPQGNAYWKLARPYVAMKLNNLNGARFNAATQAVFNTATSLLSSYTPAQVESNNNLRKQFVKAAADVRDFNQGRTGPGKCTAKPDLEND